MGTELSDAVRFVELLEMPTEERRARTREISEISVFAALQTRDAISTALKHIDGKEAWRHIAHPNPVAQHATQLDAKIIRTLPVDDQIKYFEANDTRDERKRLLEVYSRIFNMFAATRQRPTVSPAEEFQQLMTVVDSATLSHEAIGKLQIPGLHRFPTFDERVRHVFGFEEVVRFADGIRPDEIWGTTDGPGTDDSGDAGDFTCRKRG